MNIAEKTALSIGRLRAAYTQGLKAFPDAPLHSWATSSGFPVLGGGNRKGKKPETPADAIEQFTSWVYICSSLNARACASVPLRLYGAVPSKGRKIRWAGTDVAVATRPVSKARRKSFEATRHLQPYMTKSDDVEEIIDHPFLDLINNVNPFSNMSDLLELTVMFLDLAGDAYWYVVRNKAGVPEALWSMPSQYVTPVAGKTLDTFIEAYKFDRGVSSVILPIEDVVAFAYPNPKSQIRGFAPVLGVADAVYNNSQMNIYEGALFENKARVDGVFQVDGTVPMAQVERMKEKYAAEYQGAQKAGKSPILPPGLTFQKTSMTAEEISFIEGRRLTREEIAAGMDVPISLLDPNSIRSNVEGAQYYHAKFGIEPRLRKIEEKLNEKLLPMYDSKGTMFVAFDSPVPEDKSFELEARVRQTGVPVMSVNEARAEVGLEPVEGGEVPMLPFGMGPLGSDMSYGAGGGGADEQAADLAERTMKALKARLGI